MISVATRLNAATPISSNSTIAYTRLSIAKPADAASLYSIQLRHAIWMAQNAAQCVVTAVGLVEVMQLDLDSVDFARAAEEVLRRGEIP